MNIVTFSATVTIQLMKTAAYPVLTVAIEVVGLISPTGGFVRVAGGDVAAAAAAAATTTTTAVLCQEVGQSEGLPLFFSFLT